jgi:carboxypeptidase C (cathepsin A)
LRDKPAFACIATEDKSIAHEIQRAMYKRSNTTATDVKGSHMIFMSQPDAVAQVIELASNGNGK